MHAHAKIGAFICYQRPRQRVSGQALDQFWRRPDRVWALGGCQVQVSLAALMTAGSGVFPLGVCGCRAVIIVAGHERTCRCL